MFGAIKGGFDLIYIQPQELRYILRATDHKG